MIIINQDKNNVINYDNVKSLWIEDNVLDETNTTFYINADEDFLGEYVTEERAKEVLQEIIRQKSIFEYFKNVPRDMKNSIAEDFIKQNIIFDTYEMPEK